LFHPRFRGLLPFLMRQHQVGCLPNLAAVVGAYKSYVFPRSSSSSSFFFIQEVGPLRSFANREQEAGVNYIAPCSRHSSSASSRSRIAGVAQWAQFFVSRSEFGITLSPNSDHPIFFIALSACQRCEEENLIDASTHIYDDG
jgi:hypothetical protein